MYGDEEEEDDDDKKRRGGRPHAADSSRVSG